MAVAFRSASASGNSANASSRSTTVPAGAAIGDVVVAFVETWNGAVTVTPPSGFTQKGSVFSSGDGQSQNSVWWKRLTAADTGSYSFGYSGSRWSTVQALCFSGVIATGDPFDVVATPVAGTFGSITSMSLTTTDPNGAQIFTVYNDTTGTHTPPTGFTEPSGVDVDCASCAYKLNGGSSGSQSISGASVSSSSSAGAWAGALLAATGGAAPAVPVYPISQYGGFH